MRTEVAHVAVIIFSRYPFSVDQEVPETDWEVYLRETANAIVSQQSPQRCEMKRAKKEGFHGSVNQKNHLNPTCSPCRLLEVRARLYELLTHCIPPEIIMKVMPSTLPLPSKLQRHFRFILR